MLFQKCPSSERLLEFVTIPMEISLYARASVKAHSYSCAHCQKQIQQIQKTWRSYFAPEPDIASSLLRVYSRLQKDETLILKGWKLGEMRKSPTLSEWLFNRGWLFRGGVSIATATLLLLIVTAQMKTEPDNLMVKNSAPFAQIRFEDEKETKVHFVRPELLQSIEFETTSSK